MEHIKFIMRILILIDVLCIAHAYPYFRDQIPNGNQVTHPCNSSRIWDGVGHLNQAGGGKLNPFGLDFVANGRVWTEMLCRMDSDGDRRTNGEELGDPDCTWTPSSNANVTSGITHPGVCQPLDSAACTGKNDWLDCAATGDFSCPAIEREQAVKYEFRLPVTPVPARETTHECLMFELPVDKPRHLIGSNAVIDNVNVMHHGIVFGCAGMVQPPPGVEINVPYDCTNSMTRGCPEMLALWTLGIGGKCHDGDYGFLIGGDKGLKYAVIQLHWNNPALIPGMTDRSGFELYLTEQLRPNNAGIIMIGQKEIAIPPGLTSHPEVGVCGGDCTRQFLHSNISVVRVFNHMHLLGKSQITELWRDGQRVQYLAKDDTYDYNTPDVHYYDEPIVIQPGDDIQTTCVYRSEDRTEMVYFGDGTQEEMCFAFLLYYPKENAASATCVSWRSLSNCEVSSDYIRGCNLTQISNFSDPEVIAMFQFVNTLCQESVCTPECLDYWRTLRQHPCFQGDVYEWFLFSATQAQQPLSNVSAFFGRLESCYSQLLEEERKGPIGVGAKIAGHYSACALFLVLYLLF